MPEEPREMLCDGIAALAAVSSLLTHSSGPGRNNMHLVDPEELCCLLDIIRSHFEGAREGLRTSTAA